MTAQQRIKMQLPKKLRKSRIKKDIFTGVLYISELVHDSILKGAQYFNATIYYYIIVFKTRVIPIRN